MGELARSVVRSCDALLRDVDSWLKNKKRRAGLFLAALVLGYVAFWGGLTSLRHYYFHSGGDLANHDQVVWNSSQGRLFARSVEVSNDLADHVRPYLLLLSPVYVIFPSPYVLLWFQAVVLSLGALPLYRLSHRKLGSPGASLAFALCYLAYPALGFVNRFDFHAEVIAVPLLMAAYERIDAGRFKQAALCLALSLLGKESIGISVAALGIMTAVIYGHWRFGLIWGLIGLLYSFAALFWIIPVFRGGPSDTLVRYLWLGKTPWEMMATLILSPQLLLGRLLTMGNLVTFLQLIGPLAFLPIFGLPVLLPALPVLLYNFGSDYGPQKTIYYQYMTPAIPFMLAAAVEGLRWLLAFCSQNSQGDSPAPPMDETRGGLGCGIVVVLSATVIAWALANPVTTSSPMLPSIHAPVEIAKRRPTPRRAAASRILSNDAAVREALRKIPAEGKLWSSEQYLPHLSHRRDFRRIPREFDSQDIARVETILVNLQDRRSRNCETYRRVIQESSRAGFGITYDRDGVILLQKHAGDSVKLDDLIANWPGCV